MVYTTPNTTSQLMRSAAEALSEGDIERLEDLKTIVEGWMQLESERDDQLLMLDTMIECLLAS